MPLTRPYPVDKAYPNAADLRKAQSAIFPREGLFPDPVTIAAAGIAYAGSGWNVGARAFTANLKRGGTAFSQAYGAAQIANDSALANAWLLPGAPSSGSIVSLLWIRATDPTQGEATTQVSGEVGADGQPRPRAVPVFGITTGTTTVAPTLPAGAELIARVTIASTSTSAATSTIAHAYDFAHVLGGLAYFRTETLLLAAAAQFIDGEHAFALDTRNEFTKKNGAWVNPASTNSSSFGTPPTLSTGAQSAPPAGATVITRYDTFTVRTDANGLAQIGFPAFPNGVLIPVATTLSGSSQNPVINSGQLTKSSVVFVWPDNKGGLVTATMRVDGW